MANQKVYITKYALTSGMIEGELDVRDDGKSCYGKPEGYHYATGFYGKDFHLTKEAALLDCENRRVRKIQALNKQIKKLNLLSFS